MQNVKCRDSRTAVNYFTGKAYEGIRYCFQLSADFEPKHKKTQATNNRAFLCILADSAMNTPDKCTEITFNLKQ